MLTAKPLFATLVELLDYQRYNAPIRGLKALSGQLAQNFVLRCMAAEPSERCTARQAILHAWLQEIDIPAAGTTENLADQIYNASQDSMEHPNGERSSNEDELIQPSGEWTAPSTYTQVIDLSLSASDLASTSHTNTCTSPLVTPNNSFSDTCKTYSETEQLIDNNPSMPKSTGPRSTAFRDVFNPMFTRDHIVIKVDEIEFHKAELKSNSETKNTKLEPITETNDAMLGSLSPRQDRNSWLRLALVVEGFSVDLTDYNAQTLNEMMESDHNIKLNTLKLTIHMQSQPFTQDSGWLIFHARRASSSTRYFLKQTKPQSSFSEKLMLENLQCHALCKAFALEFNNHVPLEGLIDFPSRIWIYKENGVNLNNNPMELVPYIAGEYVKYNSNRGYVSPSDNKLNHVVQAFSHFTFERSKGEFLITDLQGSGSSLISPAPQARNPRRFHLMDRNLNENGTHFFFDTHICNQFCRWLGLQTNKDMVMSGFFRFREYWPAQHRVVFCSNKTCHKIILKDCARKLDEFPGLLWCQKCWPQLFEATEKRTCTGLGFSHKFYVSIFLYESLGTELPDRCPRHSRRKSII
jgi:hypothetical protein